MAGNRAQQAAIAIAEKNKSQGGARIPTGRMKSNFDSTTMSGITFTQKNGMKMKLADMIRAKKIRVKKQPSNYFGN